MWVENNLRGIAFISGVFVRLLYFRQGEHHRYPLTIIYTYIGIYIASAAAYRYTQGISIIVSSRIVLAFLLTHLAGLSTSLTIHRFLWHPGTKSGSLLCKGSVVLYVHANPPAASIPGDLGAAPKIRRFCSDRALRDIRGPSQRGGYDPWFQVAVHQRPILRCQLPVNIYARVPIQKGSRPAPPNLETRIHRGRSTRVRAATSAVSEAVDEAYRGGRSFSTDVDYAKADDGLDKFQEGNFARSVASHEGELIQLFLQVNPNTPSVRARYSGHLRVFPSTFEGQRSDPHRHRPYQSRRRVAYCCRRVSSRLFWRIDSDVGSVLMRLAKLSA